MSTLNTVIDKLRALITENHVEPKVEEMVKEVISLLTNPSVLLLEWNEDDVQKVARQMIAFDADCREEEIIENPLSKDDVEWVISRLDKYYDCNYGTTWDSIRAALDEVDLPDANKCLIKNTLVDPGEITIGMCKHCFCFYPEGSILGATAYCPFCGKEVK